MAVERILILGGYGNFGKRIAENLSNFKDLTILIAGRSSQKAERLCEVLTAKGGGVLFSPAVMDIHAPDFSAQLSSLSPDLVIHTSGSFQGQGYHVAEACMAVGCHYIDLADDRRYVSDISKLDYEAKKQDVLLVAGASSVPGLSSTVIDELINQFDRLDEIDFAIAPGNKAERGEATVRGILSYTGHPFKVFVDGQWVDRFGWMSARKMDFGKVIGQRWLANIDIPDLELLPKRYPSVKTVTFQAGLELTFLHFGMVFMAWLAKIGLVKDWSVLTKLIFNSSEILKGLGTETGGMQINLKGVDSNQRSKKIQWQLTAENGVGPYIPTISAIILAKKLIAGTLDKRGATACLGLYSLKEFDKEAKPLGIFHHTEVVCG